MLPKIKNIFLPKTLFGRLILLPSSAIIVSFIVISSLVGYYQYNYARANIQHNSQVLLKEISASIEKYLLLDDFAEIESIMRRFCLIDPIASISLIDMKNTPLLQVKKNEEGELSVTYNSAKRYETQYLHSKDLVYIEEDRHAYVLYSYLAKGNEVWWIRLEISKDASYARLMNLLIFGTSIALFFILLLSFIIFTIINRPLTEIASLTLFSSKLHKNIGEKCLVKSSISEIDDLTLSLNKLSQKLLANQDIMQDQYAKLEEFNAELTTKIEEEVRKNREKDLILLKHSRLATLAEMIGNIAHQWRQPLNAIALHVQSLEISYTLDELNEDELRSYVGDIMHQVEYLSKTIDDFRELVKDDQKEEPFNPFEVIMGTHKLIESSLKYANISLTLELEEDLMLTHGNAQTFSQALINILNNAKDALQAQNEEKTKEIKIELKRVLDKIEVRICDNGGGVNEEIIEKIFDPYFTTKHKSNGTGLGLSIAKTIIQEDLKGLLYVYNKQEGACFVMQFDQEQIPSSQKTLQARGV